MPRLVAMLLAVACCAAPLAAQAPSTDIAIVGITADGALAPGAFHRVTDRALYDNQPAFLSETVLLYTAMKEAGEDDATSTEIIRYERDSGDRKTLVATPESEYSATPVPGRAAISVVRDYGNLKQELWSYDVGGSGPARPQRNLLPAVNPVGYHAWVDAKRVILFVLGEPHTLQLATVGPDAGKVLAENPGRSLARIPGSHRMSFIHKLSEDEWWLCAIDVDAAVDGDGDAPAIEKLIRMPAGSEDTAWSPDGWVWTGHGSKLLRARTATVLHKGGPNKGEPGKDKPIEDATWQEVADLASRGVKNISRLAFDPQGGQLALVFER